MFLAIGALAGSRFDAGYPDAHAHGQCPREGDRDSLALPDDECRPVPHEPGDQLSTGQGSSRRSTRTASAGSPTSGGLEGTTRSIVMSGVPGGPSTGGPVSLEFAVAPIEGDTPAYHRAIFVRSDAQGRYSLALPPGRYWIGPKAKVLDPVRYRPTTSVFQEQEVTVAANVVTRLDLLEVGYAP